MTKALLIGVLALTSATLATATKARADAPPAPDATTATPVADAKPAPNVRMFTAADLDPAFVTGRGPIADAKPASGVWTNKVGDTAVIEAVEAPKDGPRTVAVITLDNPGVTQTRYFVLGDVEYANVEGTAYLELWNDFPGGGHFFSRTMGDTGPMKKITGTSAKRPFMLPFNAEPGMVPTKLTLNVVLPGKGKVMLSRLRLVQNGPAASQPATQHAAGGTSGGPVRIVVEADRTPPVIGNATGSTADRYFDQLRQDRRELPNAGMGYLDGQAVPAGPRNYVVRLPASPTTDMEVVPADSTATRNGLLAWADAHFAPIFLSLLGLSLAATVPLRWLIRRGRGRAVVFGFFALMLAGGVAELFAAGVAFGMSKPADAWATLLGGSAILIVVPALMLRQVRRQYDDLELRKLRAMDLA